MYNKARFLADLYSTFGKVVIYSLSYVCNAVTRVIKSHPDMKGEKTDRWKKMSSKCSTFMLIVAGIFLLGCVGCVCVCVLGGGGVIILIIKIDSIAITLGTRCDTLSLKFDLIHCSLFKSF